jgi:hypothetical protein
MPTTLDRSALAEVTRHRPRSSLAPQERVLGENRTTVLARPTGFKRADAINIPIPIEGAVAVPFGEIA